jgi:hypothetical protein
VAGAAVSADAIAGLLLIAIPLAFNAAFAMLAARFDYPDILRRPTAEVLARFEAGGTSLVLLWWGFAMTAVLFAPLVVLVSAALADADSTLLGVTTTVGVLAATASDEGNTPARREAVDVVFQSANRYLGVAVGEHLGYAFTGAWSILVGFAVTDSSDVPTELGLVGIVVGTLLMVCSLEFVGAHERSGWRVAERLTPIAYVAWSLWLIATGIALLV